MTRTKSTFLALLAVLLSPMAANADIIFQQDFESALGGNETTGGAFAINNINAALNNGTNMMGHSGTYGNNEYSFYNLNLDLTGVSGATLAFTFASSIETHFDRFNILGNGVLLSPLGGDMFFPDEFDVHRPELGQFAWSSQGNGLGQLTGLFDLSSFDGLASVDLLFQFGSDGSVTFPGINFDNLLVEGDVARVPEPGTLALLSLGLLGLGLSRRKKV